MPQQESGFRMVGCRSLQGWCLNQHKIRAIRAKRFFRCQALPHFRIPEQIKAMSLLNLSTLMLKVASLDALIRSKRAAGRSKDMNALPELAALREMHMQQN
jgi:hypothetical protein